MKIISGKLKGRKLLGYTIKGTRPTMDRVRESIFAMIQDYLELSVCLDLYAGSGAMGIEAISNGADKCYFVDCNKEAIKILKQNITLLNIQERSHVLETKDMKAVQYFVDGNISFDLIFLDPPYEQKNLTKVMRFIDDSFLLKDKGLVICELLHPELLENYKTLNLIKEKHYGSKIVKIYQKKIEQNDEKKYNMDGDRI